MISVPTGAEAQQQRVAALQQRLVDAEGGCLKEGEFHARFLHSTIDLGQLRAQNQIISVEFQGDRLYPIWQFNSRGEVAPHIAKTLDIFAKAGQLPDDWRVMSYFLQPKEKLEGLSPLSVIRFAQGGLVVAHAKLAAEENNW
jgi:hypothetical protein